MSNVLQMPKRPICINHGCNTPVATVSGKVTDANPRWRVYCTACSIANWGGKPYKPGVIETPSCWSVAADANEMYPDEKAEKPVADACEGCPMNEWGSGANGNGKKCKNSIRLALLQPDATEKSPVSILELPPTSCGSFLKVLRGLTVPVQTVVMRFSLDNKQTYPKVVTELLSPAPDTVAPFLLAAIDKAQNPISRGFDYDA